MHTSLVGFQSTQRISVENNHRMLFLKDRNLCLYYQRLALRFTCQIGFLCKIILITSTIGLSYIMSGIKRNYFQKENVWVFFFVHKLILKQFFLLINHIKMILA